MPRTHELKTWPISFAPLATGEKTFEIRRDDRGGFRPGDLLVFREYDPGTGTYSGKEIRRRVGFVLGAGGIFPGISRGYVALSLLPETSAEICGKCGLPICAKIERGISRKPLAELENGSAEGETAKLPENRGPENGPKSL